MHRLVIRYIVLVVSGRRHDGHKPDRIGTQFLDVIQFLGHAIEIPNAIPIRIAEGLHKDFIGDPRLRPVILGLLRFNLGDCDLQEQKCQQTK